MPSGITTYDFLTQAMRLVGIIATSEVPTADEINDALTMFNDLLETSSTENLFVYGSANESFNTVAGQAIYTIGVGGNFNTTRPVRIADAYCTFSGVDFPVDIIGQENYNAISLKTQQQPIIERLLYVNDNPLGLITLWPVPSQIVPLVLSTDRVLTQVANTATVLNFPPGYMIYFKHALAILLAPDYGMQVSASVAQTAVTTKANIKRANKQKVTARFDEGLGNSGPAMWQRGY